MESGAELPWCVASLVPAANLRNIHLAPVSPLSQHDAVVKVHCFTAALTLLDDVLALPDHGNNGAGAHVLDETRVEGLALEVLVVLLEVLLRGVDHLEGDELVAALLETLDDLTDESALDAVRLDLQGICMGGQLGKRRRAMKR